MTLWIYTCRARQQGISSLRPNTCFLLVLWFDITHTKTHITHRDQHHLFCVYISYLDYTEWIICWYQKFALQSSTMSLLLKNYWHVETTYLMIKFSNTKLFLWNTKKGINKINGVNHVCNTWMVNGVWK